MMRQARTVVRYDLEWGARSLKWQDFEGDCAGEGSEISAALASGSTRL